MITYVRLVYFLVVLSILLREAATQTGTDAKNLRTQLFVTDGYDAKVRSASNVSDPTEVWVSFSLLSINGLDEASETLKTTGYLYINWQDSFLVWNASDYGGLSYSFFPQDDVWKPDVALKNSVVEYKELGVESLNVEVFSTGTVKWQPFQMFQSSCAIDITNYPFDVQTCSLQFVAWSYTKYEVDLRQGTEGIDLYEYQNHSVWELVRTTTEVEVETDEASVVFTLTIRRKPRFIILTVVLPIIMLSLLNVSTFLLPCDSGEKASYSVTVFLSLAVFLTIVSDSLPENSDSISLFSSYLIVQLVQSTVITVLAMVLIRMSNFRSSSHIPRVLVFLVDVVFCKACRAKAAKVEPADSNEPIKMETIDESFDTVYIKPNPDKGENVLDDDSSNWKEVVNALDVVFACFFSLVTFISTVVFLGVTYSSTV